MNCEIVTAAKWNLQCYKDRKASRRFRLMVMKFFSQHTESKFLMKVARVKDIFSVLLQGLG